MFLRLPSCRRSLGWALWIGQVNAVSSQTSPPTGPAVSRPAQPVCGSLGSSKTVATLQECPATPHFLLAIVALWPLPVLCRPVRNHPRPPSPSLVPPAPAFLGTSSEQPGSIPASSCMGGYRGPPLPGIRQETLSLLLCPRKGCQLWSANRDP